MKTILLILIPFFSFSQIVIKPGEVATKIIQPTEITGGNLVISGTIDFAGKIINIEKGTTLSGNAIIKNGIIEASKDQSLFGAGIQLENVKSANGVFYSEWFGANGSDTEPDDAALQKGIDYVVNNDIGQKVFEISPGFYKLDKGLVVWRDKDGNGNPEFVNVKIRGMIGAYMQTSNEVTLYCNHSNGFALSIQRGKGVIVENINIVGQNILYYSANELFNPASTFLANGNMRTNFKSPYAGIVMDFAGESVDGDDRYPGFENYYEGITGNGGSTDCKFYNVAVSGFVVGIILSPNTNTQNNEAHVFENIWISNCRDGFVTTNSQERTVQCRNFKFWNNVRTCFRTNGYGMSRGEVPQIESANFAGVFELFHFSGAGGYFPVISINKCHAEAFYWIGTVKGIAVQFNGCLFTFALATELGIKNQDFIVSGSDMVFQNCVLVSYGDTKAPYNIQGRTKFINCNLQNPIAYKYTEWTIDFYQIEYENCSFYTMGGFTSNGSFESYRDGYINITYGSQLELASYNKEYASYKVQGFAQYRKVKTPLVRMNLISGDALVTVTGNKAVCSVNVAQGELIYATLSANGQYGYAVMTATNQPYHFDHVISSMVTGTYALYTITTASIAPVGFVFGGRLYMERTGDKGPYNAPHGTIISNYEYDEYGFCTQNPLTNPNIPNGVAFTRGAIYKNQSASIGTGWICTKSGVKGSASPPTFKSL